MFDAERLGIIAQLGLGLAGFSGITLVLARGGRQLTWLEASRLGVMLGTSLGATFLSVLPLVLPPATSHLQCNLLSGVMAAYTAGYVWFYVTVTLKMRAVAPEIVHPLPFLVVSIGHFCNFILQVTSLFDLVDCTTAYSVGLFWLLVHGAYQFGRILFIRPRSDDL